MAFSVLLLLLIGVPLGELYVLIEVGGYVGAFTTLGLVVLTALAGVWLVRSQGFSILSRIRATLDRGEVPALEVVEGALLMAAGLALLVPGFVTDLGGFALLVPPLRQRIVRRLIRNWQVTAATGAPAEGRRHTPHVIEGDWRRE